MRAERQISADQANTSSTPGSPPRVGDALMPLLGLGHHEFPGTFPRCRDRARRRWRCGAAVRSGSPRACNPPARIRPALEYAHLGRVLEPLREQGDDGRVHIVDGLPERLDLGHGDRGLRIMPCGVGAMTVSDPPPPTSRDDGFAQSLFSGSLILPTIARGPNPDRRLFLNDGTIWSMRPGCLRLRRMASVRNTSAGSPCFRC